MVDTGKAPRRSEGGELKLISAVGIFAISLIMILAAAYAAFVHYATHLRQSVADDLLGIATLKKSLLEEQLRERKGDLRVLAHHSAVQALLNPGVRPTDNPGSELKRVVPEFIDAYGYRRIVIYDAARQPVYPEQAANRGVVPAAALDAALSEGKLQLVDMFRGEAGDALFGFIQPIYIGQKRGGRPDGAIYAEIDAGRRLLPILLRWPTPSRTGETVLFRVDGAEVVMLGALRNAPERAAFSVRLPVADTTRLSSRAVGTGVDQVLEGVDSRGVPSIGSFVRIDGTPWTLGARMSHEEAEAEVVDLRNVTVFLAALFVLLAGSGSYAFLRFQARKADAEVGARATQYLVALATSIDGYARLNHVGSIVEVNDALLRMTGYGRQELMQMHLSDLVVRDGADDMPSSLQRLRAAGSSRFQTIFRCKDGGLVDIDASVTCYSGVGGESFYFYVRDITETVNTQRSLERLNRYYAFMGESATAILPLRDAHEILEACCRIAVEKGGFLLVWGGIVDTAGPDIRVVSANGKAAAYARGLQISTDPSIATGQGPAGQALREMRTIRVQNFVADRTMEPWHARATDYGVRASASVPIVVGGRAVAVLCFYSDVAGYFNEEEVVLLEQTAHSVAVAWEAGSAGRERDGERAMASARCARRWKRATSVFSMHRRCRCRSMLIQMETWSRSTTLMNRVSVTR